MPQILSIDIDNLLTIQQAQQLLGMSRMQTWRYGQNGLIRTLEVAGVRFYYRDDILTLLELKKQEAANGEQSSAC